MVARDVVRRQYVPLRVQLVGYGFGPKEMGWGLG